MKLKFRTRGETKLTVSSTTALEWASFARKTSSSSSGPNCSSSGTQSSSSRTSSTTFTQQMEYMKLGPTYKGKFVRFKLSNQMKIQNDNSFLEKKKKKNSSTFIESTSFSFVWSILAPPLQVQLVYSDYSVEVCF